MTTSPSPATPCSSSSNGASLSSLPRWRRFLSTLNWRRDPGYEQRKMQHELRMKQLESEISRVRSDSERIERETKQIEKETKQIEKETEQLQRENARARALSALIEQHCFPDESNSIPLPPIEPDSSTS
jgi:septal ring factor EnvC (AmiA/AmiB activator)